MRTVLDARERAYGLARAALKRRATNVVILDVRKLTSICDYFVLCTGRSTIHVGAVADEMVEALSEHGVQPGHIEGRREARWVLLDYLSVVAHVFTQEAREYYGLERLWADAPREEITDNAPLSQEK
ncbi:MAG: ribosome silencing factor [Armatimonadetes bacterium]|nr:ribosome silencing factor [Armatimonadota bacterium]